MFKTIRIIRKPNDSTSDTTADELSQFLQSKGVNVVFGLGQVAQNIDLIIVVGGDGTLLNTARSFANDNIPILGVNLGRLGFLADVSVAHMRTIVSEVLAGEFIQEERALLSCQITQNNQVLSQYLAFNDVVVHRKEALKMIEFDVFIDNKLVNSQRADGLIVTTPTGSTAYALSSGGPIIHPGINAIGLVSICPHTMSHRPLLIPSSSKVMIQVKDLNEGASVSFDGQASFVIAAGQAIEVCQHPQFIHLLHPKNYDYFEIIRSKLHWGSKLS